MKKTLMLKPGDIVSVAEADVVFVYGNVNKQGQVTMREPLTLTQAIASAEGLKPATKKDDIRILRQKEGSSDREEFVFDLREIDQRKVPDPILMPNDVVAVGEDRTKSILNSIGRSLTNGIPSSFTAYLKDLNEREQRNHSKPTEPITEIDRALTPRSSVRSAVIRLSRYLRIEGFNLLDYWRYTETVVAGDRHCARQPRFQPSRPKPNIYLCNIKDTGGFEQTNPDLVTSDRRYPPIWIRLFQYSASALNSDTLLRRVIKDHSLDTNKEFQAEITSSSPSALRSVLRSIGLSGNSPSSDKNASGEANSLTSGLVSSEEIEEAVRLAPYVELIKKNLSVEPVREPRTTLKDTRLIDVSYRHTDPELAAFIVNSIGETFAQTNQEQRTGTSRKTSDYLKSGSPIFKPK